MKKLTEEQLSDRAYIISLIAIALSCLSIVIALA